MDVSSASGGSSMLKRVDIAVYEVIKDSKEGKFSAGTVRFGIKNQGVDYAIDKYNEKLLPAEVKKKIDQLKSEIANGKISVPDYYKRGGH